MEKMCRKAKKTILQHEDKESVYVTFQEAQSSSVYIQKPVTFSYSTCARQGTVRETMEDRHFVHEMDKGILAAVFDGHAGHEVAEFAKQFVKEEFERQIKKDPYHIHKVFEHVVYNTNQKVFQNEEWDDTGTVAVICYILKRTGLIFTATIGDCCANIYRKIDKDIRSIPLSYMYNWASKSEAIRAAYFKNDPKIVEEYVKNSDMAKWLRPISGNFSRAIGNKRNRGDKVVPVVIPKPEITVSTVQPGDTVVLMCDGIYDVTGEQDIVDVIEGTNESKQFSGSLASRIVHYALFFKKSDDNCTAIAISVH
jgi:serine/threonine protein phosphatase PrpC